MKAQVQKGFTLIELMIVVAIIGILAASALPAYQDYTARSQMSEAMTLASGARTAVTEFYSAKGYFPTVNESAGLADATDITGNYVAQVDTADGIITATLKDTGVAEGIAEAELILSPVTAAGSVTWICKRDSSTLAKYYPTSCRNE